MPDTSHIKLRDARDRLIDLLAIGQTYPLQDLAVPDDQLTVAYNTAAQVPIEDSQKGVLYQLHDDEQVVERASKKPEGGMIPIRALGNGSRINLETAEIQEDITFEIFARKIPWYLFGIDLSGLTSQQRAGITRQLNNNKLPDILRGFFFSERSILIPEEIIVDHSKVQDSWVIRKTGFEFTYRITKKGQILEIYQTSGMKAYLHESATVKVGLDISLEAHILDAARLVAENQTPTDSSPYLIDYADTVKVEVKNSQEGVDYYLVYFKENDPEQPPEEISLSEGEIRGDLSNIVLSSNPVYEDVDIRIRATKTFDPSENRPDESALLDAMLPLRVRANSGLEISTTSPVCDYNASVTIKIANTQSSASYQAYIRQIKDRDYIHPVEIDDQIYRVSVEGQPEVQVLKPLPALIEVAVSDADRVRVSQPAREHPWETPAGFSAWDKAQPGNGGDLEISIDNLVDDSLVIVRAEKIHQADPDAPIPTAVQLEQALAILVRPNPGVELKVEMDSANELQVSNGQPGVFYTFYLQPDDNTALGSPAYFHKVDDFDETLNLGIGQLNLEVDFAIARSVPAEQASEDPGRTAPLTPIVEIDPIPADATSLSVRATKAQTRLEAWLDNPVEIPPEQT